MHPKSSGGCAYFDPIMLSRRLIDLSRELL